MINLVSASHALAVAEHLSFSRAAQVLRVRQSAVSRRARALEDVLGVSLFERHSIGVRLRASTRKRQPLGRAKLDLHTERVGWCCAEQDLFCSRPATSYLKQTEYSLVA